jgi:hypothetical protein
MSEMVSDVDMEEEKQILQSLKKKEFMSENQNENLMEVDIIQNNENSPLTGKNQTYKMIMNAQNISNNEDFSIEDDSDEEEESEEENEQDPSESKYEQLMNNANIEPIAEEDGEESKYMPTPQKHVTSKIETMKAVN